MKKKIILMILLFTFVSISSYTFSKNECTWCTNWSCCSRCNTQECRNWNNRVNRCSGSIDSSAINWSTINYLTEQDGHCCFESIESPYNCNNWGIIPRMQGECPDIANQINSDNVHNILKKNWYCCFDGWNINSDYSCTLLDSVYEKKTQCPAIANEINWDTINYVTVEDWYCCFSWWWVSHGDLTCWVQRAKSQCPNIASQITLGNNFYLDTDSCCFSLEEAWEDDCSFLWSNYVQEWDCCIMWEWCANPPQNWECESWYKLENACCVPLSCEEENSGAKATCDARRNSWEAVKRDSSKCKCVCDPSMWCCWVKLNTVVPFIWDCIEMTNGNDTTQWVNQLNAFPYLMKWITKILITAIMIFSIIIVIAAWFLMSTSVASEGNYKKWVELLKNVLICLILLWCSWLILKLVNPNFFG